MLADVGVVEPALHADRRQLLGGADPREQQQLGGADRPRAHHDLAVGEQRGPGPVGVAAADARGPQPAPVGLEQHLLDQAVGDHGQVGPLQRGLEERVVRRGPLAVARGGLEQRRDAHRTTAVASVVVTARDAGRLGGLHELLGGDGARRPHGHPERSTRAVRVLVDHHVVGRLGRHEVLALGEVGQHVVVGPALAAVGGPAVEVPGVAAHVGHVVEARRAAQHLAARHHHPAVGEPLAGAAGVAGVHPVDVGIELQRRDRGRHRLVRRRRAAGLDQRHPQRGVLAQPGRDHRTRRATPDHDDVETDGLGGR